MEAIRDFLQSFGTVTFLFFSLFLSAFVPHFLQEMTDSVNSCLEQFKSLMYCETLWSTDTPVVRTISQTVVSEKLLRHESGATSVLGRNIIS
jgi:hypothetical protein